MGLFSRKSSEWVGIDIGSAAVKLVSLSKADQVIKLNGYAIIPLSPGAVVDGKVAEVATVTEVIQRGLKVMGGKATKAVVSVPTSAVITKEIGISNLFFGIELEEQVKIEADQFIPYPLDEVALDFAPWGHSKHNPDLNNYLLVASRKDITTPREAAVNAAGIKCDIIDVENFAMERTLSLLDVPDDPAYSFAIVDIGADTILLNVYQGKEAIYNREQSFEGYSLIQSLQQQCQLNAVEVLVALREQSLPTEIYEDLVQPFTQRVVQQIVRAMQFYYSSSTSGSHQPVSHLYLCGGLTALPGLVELTEQELSLPVDFFKLNQYLQLGRRINPKKFNQDVPALVKALGLGLRGLGALKHE